MNSEVVYIVEDEVAISDYVANLLQQNGYNVKAFSSGENFLDQWDGGLQGCILLDMRMPGISGLDVLKHMSEATKVLPVLLFTSVVDMQLAIDAAKSGVFDYCPKPFTNDVILAKVAESIKVNRLRLQEKSGQVAVLKALMEMTPRESEVLDLLCQGLSSKQISAKLNISVFTVDNHRARIMIKLGVSSVSQVVQLTLNARK